MRDALVRIIGEWWAMGPYDAVMIAEAPDEETMNRFLLGAGRQGNIRTTTMRAFTQDEIMQHVWEGETDMAAAAV